MRIGCKNYRCQKMNNKSTPLPVDRVFNEYDQVLFLMDEISRAARKAFDDRVIKLGLNRTQWRVLAQIIRDPALTQTEIAKNLDLEPATIGLAIKALSERGFLEKRRDPRDGRAWSLTLTPSVTSVLPDLRRAADAVHAILWSGISPETRAALQDILEHLSVNAGAFGESSTILRADA